MFGELQINLGLMQSKVFGGIRCKRRESPKFKTIREISFNGLQTVGYAYSVVFMTHRSMFGLDKAKLVITYYGVSNC